MDHVDSKQGPRPVLLGAVVAGAGGRRQIADGIREAARAVDTQFGLVAALSVECKQLLSVAWLVALSEALNGAR